MDDKHVLVECLSALNNVVVQTFQSTQRIKLTSFDVSKKFVVFGASSGGIYIFKRSPYKFFKLIPSKEGAAIKVLISSNERNLALASVKGFVIIVQNFSTDVALDYQIYTEHEGLTITSMIWNNNDLYCGDHTGKVSVISLVNILSKAIFQTPSSTLMQLDSCIVQLDVYSKFLLISTLTRSYLCNTEREEYRQIGKKTRDGPYGACFYNAPKSVETNTESYHSFKGVFKILREDERFSECLTSDVKIYCSRPGARLWEASFEASVLVTHQFRSSLKQSPSDLLFIEDGSEAALKITKFLDVKSVPDYFNFRKIYPVLNRFILTYDNDNIYVFDPLNGCLAFWCNKLNNINDVILVDSHIFILQEDSRIHILLLVLLEELIIKTLVDKQYYICSDLCISYKDDILQLIEKSKKIHLISSLKDKNVGAERSEQLNVIFKKLSECSAAKCNKIKLNGGIVVIDNAFKQVDRKSLSLEKSRSDIKERSEMDEPKNINKILEKQYVLNKSHGNIETIELTRFFAETSLNELLTTFENFVNYVKEKLNEDSMQWVRNQFLKQSSRKIDDLTQLNEPGWSFLKDAFMDVNNSEEMRCKCNFPLPKCHLNKPKFYNLADELTRKFLMCPDFINKVPYLNKILLDNLEDLTDFNKNLSLIVQFSDKEIFQKYLNSFAYDTWDETVKHFLRLSEKKCLNCCCDIDADGVLNWSQIGMLMIQSIGAKNTIKLLKRYVGQIKGGDLDVVFFQSCIFSTAIDISPSTSLGFVETVTSEGADSCAMFENMMEKFLQKKYMGENMAERLMPSGNNSCPLKCTYCQLPLNTRIIDETKSLSCGHVYHSICLQMINNMCNVCVEIL